VERIVIFLFPPPLAERKKARGLLRRADLEDVDQLAVTPLLRC
jgi:hypothetical protein